MLEIFLHNFISFIAIISALVFVHEFGHFFVARLCSVKVEQFAIGFGKEIFGFYDKKGTRWKFCALPLGGYVKMFGDKNSASMPDEKAIAKMSEADKKQSFIFKNVYQRIAIVAAGPAINFVFAIFIFTILFKINGLNVALPIVDEVVKDSAAFEVGLQKNDEILAIDDKKIENFDEMRMIVEQSADKELLFQIRRSYKIIEIKITPKSQEKTNIFGEKMTTGLLGVSSNEISHKDLNILQSFWQANVETLNVSKAIFVAIGELITGKRDIKELGGPIKIAKYSGKTVEMGFVVVLWFMALISINLGVMNLLPIPILDGGHLLFYAIEAIRGKPLTEKTQQFGYQIGLTLVLSLMIFTTYNDITQLLK